MRGTGETTAIAYSVAPGALGFWEAHLGGMDMHPERLEERFGADGIGFDDPDGMRIELIEDDRPLTVRHWEDGPIPAAVRAARLPRRHPMAARGRADSRATHRADGLHVRGRGAALRTAHAIDMPAHRATSACTWTSLHRPDHAAGTLRQRFRASHRLPHRGRRGTDRVSRASCCPPVTR